MEMKSKCRRLKGEEGLDLVVIDYLQLMTPEGRADSRTQERSDVYKRQELSGIIRDAVACEERKFASSALIRPRP